MLTSNQSRALCLSIKHLEQDPAEFKTEKMNYLSDQMNYIRNNLECKGLWSSEFCKKIVELSTYSTDPIIINSLEECNIENIATGSKEAVYMFKDAIYIRTFKDLGAKYELGPKVIKVKMRKQIDRILFRLQADYMKLKYIPN